MAQEDKLKREIDLLGKLLAKILQSLTGPDNSTTQQEAFKEVKQKLQERGAYDVEWVFEGSTEELKNNLAHKTIEQEHGIQLAEILYQLAEKPGAKDDSKIWYEKSLALYEYLTTMNGVYSLDSHYKIETIKKRLSALT